MKNHILFLAVLACSFTPIFVMARWGEPSEAALADDYQRLHIKVKKDGRYILTYESQTEVLKDIARAGAGMVRISFNSSGGTLKILEAKTINKNKVMKVSPKAIEIKPLASAGQGFDARSQATIAYPDVNVGSKIFLKYQKEIRPSVPGLFTYESMVGVGVLVKNFEFIVEAEMPLFYELNNPGNVLVASQTGNKIVVKSKEPLFKAIMDEESPLLDAKSIPIVAISSIQEWKELPLTTIRKYETEIQSPLPEKFLKISEQAKLKKSPVEQINAVTSLLSEDVRYNGDWRTVKGAFHPRSLEVISKSGYGDCKDFTVAAGAILRTLGFEAHAAWTNRGFDVMERPYNLPVLGFNHAILHIKKDEKEYWIDPTNFASFAQGVPDDIENKLAIILKPSGAVKARTEAGKSEDKFNKVVLNLNFDKDSLITGTGEIVLKGASSFSMTGAELNGSKQSTEYSLLKWALNESNISSWGFEPYSLKSRIVKDVTTSFKFTFPWFPVLTSAGKGFLVSLPPDVPSLVTNRAQRVSYLNFQGSPYRIVREYHIKGRSVAMESEFDCQGSSQWADFSRRFIKNGSDVVLVDDFSLKVRTISPEDISTKLYGDFQEKLRSCMQRAVVVFRPN